MNRHNYAIASAIAATAFLSGCDFPQRYLNFGTVRISNQPNLDVTASVGIGDQRISRVDSFRTVERRVKNSWEVTDVTIDGWKLSPVNTTISPEGITKKYWQGGMDTVPYSELQRLQRETMNQHQKQMYGVRAVLDSQYKAAMDANSERTKAVTMPTQRR